MLEAMRVSAVRDSTPMEVIAVRSYHGTAYFIHPNYIGLQFSSYTECTDGDLRLIDGTNDFEGRVEMCKSNSYGTICDDRWELFDAIVACRQLGYNGK